VLQITYPTPHNTNPQVKIETNPPPPLPLPQPQAQEPLQQPDMFPTHGTRLTITGSSNTNFETKRQHKDYYHQANHVSVDGPITQTKWSHMPITFSSQDVNLTSFLHTDAMVITVHINRWDVTKILFDNGSQAKILFLATFDKMASVGKQLNQSGPSHSLYPMAAQEPPHRIHHI
jgi:hypothetical protein